LILACALALFAAASETGTSGAPYAFATVLRPNWSNPGAFYTDFARVTLDGEITDRYEVSDYYDLCGVADSVGRKVFMVSSCTMAGSPNTSCTMNIFNPDNYDKITDFLMKDLYPINFQFDRKTNSIVGVGAVTKTFPAIQYVVFSIDLGTFETTVVEQLPNILGVYISRGAIDPEGRRYFFGSFLNMDTCALNIYDIDRGTIMMAYKFPCKTGDLSQLQYSAANDMLYFIVLNTPMFSSFDPKTGIITPLLNITSSSAGGIMNYFASFVDPQTNTYWAQLFQPTTYKQFMVQIDLNGSPKLTKYREYEGNMLFSSVLLQ